MPLRLTRVHATPVPPTPLTRPSVLLVVVVVAHAAACSSSSGPPCSLDSGGVNIPSTRQRLLFLPPDISGPHTCGTAAILDLATSRICVLYCPSSRRLVHPSSCSSAAFFLSSYNLLSRRSANPCNPCNPRASTPIPLPLPPPSLSSPFARPRPSLFLLWGLPPPSPLCTLLCIDSPTLLRTLPHGGLTRSAARFLSPRVDPPPSSLSLQYQAVPCAHRGTRTAGRYVVGRILRCHLSSLRLRRWLRSRWLSTGEPALTAKEAAAPIIPQSTASAD